MNEYCIAFFMETRVHLKFALKELKSFLPFYHSPKAVCQLFHCQITIYFKSLFHLYLFAVL